MMPPALDPDKLQKLVTLQMPYGKHKGTLLAIEELNAAGGLLGKKLELITEDDLSKAGEPATVVNKLIARDGVVAVLGEVASSRSLEAAPICQQNKIPMISPAANRLAVGRPSCMSTRACSSTFTPRYVKVMPGRSG